MLDITTITRQNVTSVVGYYSDAKDDYYSKDSSLGFDAQRNGFTR